MSINGRVRPHEMRKEHGWSSYTLRKVVAIGFCLLLGLGAAVIFFASGFEKAHVEDVRLLGFAGTMDPWNVTLRRFFFALPAEQKTALKPQRHFLVSSNATRIVDASGSDIVGSRAKVSTNLLIEVRIPEACRAFRVEHISYYQNTFSLFGWTNWFRIRLPGVHKRLYKSDLITGFKQPRYIIEKGRLRRLPFNDAFADVQSPQ